MKAKKKLRQEAQREQKRVEQRNNFYNNLQTVKLRPDAHEHGIWRWTCQKCNITQSWSHQINDMWGHPRELAFCGVCMVYHKPEMQ